MKSNKIAIRLLLSITIIFAGLILLVGAKKEVHLYNLEEYELTAGSGAITFLATFDICRVHNGIPQPNEIKNLGYHIYCIQRGGKLSSYGIPEDLSSVASPYTLRGLSKTKTKLWDNPSYEQRISYTYSFNSNNLEKYKNKTDEETGRKIRSRISIYNIFFTKLKSRRL